MPNTMTLISTITVNGGGPSSFEFTSIPQTFTDLMLLSSVRTTRDTYHVDEMTMTFNGNTTSGAHDWRWLGGTGGAAGSGLATNQNSTQVVGATTSISTTNTFGNSAVYIPNYTSSTTNKSISSDFVLESNTGTLNAYAFRSTAAIWRNTSAITSISILGFASLVAGSTISLYGILKGSGGATVS